MQRLQSALAGSRASRLALAAVVIGLFAPPVRAQVATDQINLSQVTVYNSPADVASWPITQSITALHMRPSGDPISGEIGRAHV